MWPAFQHIVKTFIQRSVPTDSKRCTKPKLPLLETFPINVDEAFETLNL